VGLALFVAVALFVGIILDGGHQAYRVTVLTIIAAAATYRLVSYGAAVVLARDASSHRMVPLTDAESAGLTSTVRRVATVSLSAAALCYWIANLGHSHSAHQLLLIVSTFICAVLLVVGTYRHRAAIGKIILGGETSEGQPALRRVIASAWFMPVAVYFIVAWGIGAVNVLLDRPLAFWLVVGPIGIAIMTLLAYWLMVYVIDRVFPDPAHLHGVAGVAAGNGEALAATAQPPTETRVDAPLETGSEATEEQPEDPAPMVLVRSPMHLLFERGAVVLAGILAVFLLGDLWGVGLTEEGMGAAFRDIGIICFLGYLAFDAVRIAINHRMALEEPADAAGDGDAEFGQGATRLATLLPLVRNAVLITISVIVMMVVLSKLGVDIGPLLAGAGVIGIAVGFGAQTLVRDVISGMFFLLDDAFRRGEYIDVGTVKGTVERISIRSMQLRHHRGALHTVPFGEVSRLTNHSRDWAIMKLPIRVTYDTDVEQLRKWIKKMGQDLLQHPEHGPKFIDPVKSQGVVQMEDSAMILRVKFKSKPQDQFVLRKVIYAKIQDLFEEHDIPFAHREVLVRVASDDDESSPKLGDKQKAQVAGAAAQAVSEPAVPATTGDAR
jgi:small-conductance mechanosensitive channel